MMNQNDTAKTIQLPVPNRSSSANFESTLAGRRSVRHFTDRKLGIEQISQLLWAAQGITSSHGFRTAPSAGALYPLEIYVVSGPNTGLAAGVYNYRPDSHSLTCISAADLRDKLCRAALSQAAVKNAPVTFLITAVFQRTAAKYGQRGFKYVFMEAGHAGQNILLQAEALKLGAVPIGAFEEKEIIDQMNLPAAEHPLYLIPVGYKVDR